MLQLEFLDLSLGEIMAFFADQAVVAWVLILSGGLAAVWLLENITDPIPLLGTIFDGLQAIGTYLGFFVGILDMLVGYVVWVTQPGATIVAGILVLTGFSLVMRVLSKFPLAFLFAIAIALFGAFTIYGFLAPYATAPVIGEYIVQIISFKWMAVIAFVIFCVAYLLAGILIKIIELIGKVFASTPVSVLIGLGCMAIGVVVFLAPDLLGLTIPWPAP
jgi:hypothetical protein